MAIPYFCSTCGDIVGTEKETISLGRVASGFYNSETYFVCPGKGLHKNPEINEVTTPIAK